MSIKPGQEVRDRITGFSGTATARTEYIYGCVQIQITSHEMKDGETCGQEWFDEQGVERIGKKKFKFHKEPIGGPQDEPPARNHPGD